MRDPVAMTDALISDLARAARRGDLTTLAQRLPELEAAGAMLATVSDRAALDALRARAAALAPVLAATAEGVKAALARLHEIRAARSGLSVYTPEGRQTLAADGLRSRGRY